MMTISNANIRIGPVENRILQALDRKRRLVWRVSAESLPSGVTPSQAWKSLHLLTAAGLLERIERGSYLVQPRSGRTLVAPLDLLGAWFADEPYAVVGHAAAEAHRLTLDTSNIVEVQLGRPKAPVEFQGVRYVFSNAQKESLGSDNALIRTGQVPASVASPGKVLVLLLNRESSRRSGRPTRDTRLAIEVLERGASANLWTKTDWPRLVRRHGNAATARRLGFLLERAGITGAEALLPLRGKAGNQSFSSVHPPEGPVNTRWGLILNDPLVR
jgi:predicted transcriptional regulator of viral defense system